MLENIIKDRLLVLCNCNLKSLLIKALEFPLVDEDEDNEWEWVTQND